MPRGIPSSQPPTTTPGQKISALLKGPAGKNPDLSELPQEHEIYLIDEAREYYTSDPPVFLSDNQRSAGTVNKAWLASEGHTGASGVRISVTTRAWSKRGGVYQTIDLNRERVIVKMFRGGPRGGFYRRWMGVVAGFEKPMIAYACNEAREAREARKMKKMLGRASLPGDDSEFVDLVTSDARPARKRKSLPSFVDQSGDTSEDDFISPKRVKAINSSVLREKRPKEIEKSPKPTPTNRTGQLAPAATMNPPKSRQSLSRASVTSSTAAPEVGIKQEPGASENRMRLSGTPKAPSVPIMQPANTSSVRSPGQVSNSNLSSRPTPPSNRDNPSRDNPKSDHPSINTTTSSSSSKAVALSVPRPNQKDKYEELISNFLSSPPLTTTTTTTTSSQTQPNTSSSLAAAVAPILSPKKQAATILSVYLNPNEDYVPLYLRSCMTISRFFASCLGAFELEERPEMVSALRVRLEHIQTTTGAAAAAADEGGIKQQGASWLVKRAVPDSFDIFLEAVNQWAGWKDKESCAVRVEIILRANP